MSLFWIPDPPYKSYWIILLSIWVRQIELIRNFLFLLICSWHVMSAWRIGSLINLCACIWEIWERDMSRLVPSSPFVKPWPRPKTWWDLSLLSCLMLVAGTIQDTALILQSNVIIIVRLCLVMGLHLLHYQKKEKREAVGNRVVRWAC